MIPCPDTETLKEFLEETLSLGERDEIAVHLETCVDCEQALEQLSREQVSWLSPPMLDPMRGLSTAAVARFRLVHRLEGGGQGDIYLARDEELQRDVAVKRIKDRYSGDWRRRAELIREALITGSLEHPGIVPVYALGYDGEGQSYYAMRLIRSIAQGQDRGNTLEDAIADFHAGGDAWTMRKLLDRFLAVCNTIQYAHDQGVLHCDLKPRNVVLGPYGETLVLDWGAARSISGPSSAPWPLSTGLDRGESDGEQEGGSSRASHFFLTPAFASPELRNGRLDDISCASDIYSLGIMLSCLLAGGPPSRIDDEPVEPQREGRPPGKPAGSFREPGVPKPLDAVCRRALAERPADRYPSARALADDVGRWLADEPVTAYREGLIGGLTRLARRHRAWTSAVAAALLLVTIVSASAAWWIDRARGRAVELSAELAHDRGNLLCQQGDVSRGALWLARSLEISERASSEARRVNLAAWSHRLCTLTDFYTLPGGLRPRKLGPSGGLLIAQDEEGNSRLWSVAERKPVGPQIPTQTHTHSVFSHDGHLLLISGADRLTRIRNTTTGEAIGSPIQHQGDVLAAHFSADGSIVLIGCGDGSAQAWDVRSGRALGPAVRHPRAVQAVVLGNDGRTALSASVDGEAWLWDPRTGRRMGKPIHHGEHQAILAAALSPDGQTVMTSGVDRGVRFWRASTGEPMPEDQENLTSVDFVRFSDDRRSSLVGSSDGTIHLLDLASGKLRGRPIRHPGPPRTARLSPDGRMLLTGSDDRTARLWHIESGEPAAAPMVHQEAVTAVAFSADGKRVVSGSEDGNLRVWALPSGETQGILRPYAVAMDAMQARPGERSPLPRDSPYPDSDWIRATSFGALGRVLLTATIGGRVQLWEVATGRPLGAVIQEVPPLNAACLSPDGTRALTTGGDRTVKLWDTFTGRCLQVLTHEGVALAVSFMPALDGHSAVTGGGDRKARIWNLVTGELMAPPLNHDAWVIAVASSPDGRTVLTGSLDGSVRRWDARTGQLLDGPLRLVKSASTIYFSADGRTALIGGKDARGRIFELPGGTPIGDPLPHRGIIRDAAFRRDGRVLLTASDDGIVQVWEVETGKSLGPITLQEGGICSLSLGGDGRTVATGSKSGLARVWDLVRPIGGDPDRVRREIEIRTGLELDQRGIIAVLEPGSWRERRDRIRELEVPTDHR